MKKWTLLIMSVFIVFIAITGCGGEPPILVCNPLPGAASTNAREIAIDFGSNRIPKEFIIVGQKEEVERFLTDTSEPPLPGLDTELFEDEDFRVLIGDLFIEETQEVETTPTPTISFTLPLPVTPGTPPEIFVPSSKVPRNIALAKIGNSLEDETSSNLSFQQQATPPPNPIFPFEPAADLIIQLVRVQSGESGPELIDFYNRMVALNIDGLFVDYNYVIGRNPREQIAGDPNGVGAKTFGLPVSRGNQQELLGHWAFAEPYGVNLHSSQMISNTTNFARTIVNQGAGSRVVLFDTSPYTMSGTKEIPLDIPGNVATFNLCVSHPTQLTEIAPDPNLQDLKQHGLFGGALAYMVAPESQYDLVRVLGNNGRGNLFDLLKAIVNYGRINRDDLPNIVINLSLGVDSPNPLAEEEYQDIRGALESMYDSGTLVLDNDAETFIQGEEGPNLALKAVLSTLDALGTRITAAAGNDSGSIVVTNPPTKTQEPANFDFVTGVMASDQEGRRSCFSNAGDVAAPGGNAFNESSGMCEANLIQNCDTSGNPLCNDIGLISIVLKEEGTTGADGEYEFAYWYGTSFATPLVSGLEALTLSDQKQDVLTCPAEIEIARPSSSTDAIGIINVKASLEGNASICPNP